MEPSLRKEPRPDIIIHRTIHVHDKLDAQQAFYAENPEFEAVGHVSSYRMVSRSVYSVDHWVRP